MRLLVCLSLLLFTLPAFSQRTHELKTDLLLPAMRITHLAYEYSPNGRWGFEAGMFFSWGHEIVAIPPEGFDPDYCDCYFDLHYARQYQGIVQLSARHYFFEKQAAAGLYGGLYVLKAFHIWREKTYDQLYEERVGEPPVFFERQHFGIGVQAGYKWLLFKNRLLLEPNVGVDFDPRRHRGPYAWRESRVYLVPTVKLGFRFP